MDTVYRTKAEVPPDPPHVRLLSTLHRLRPMTREREVAPPVSVPIWSQVQPDPGPPPAERLTPAQASGARTAGLVIGALVITGWMQIAGMVAYRRYLRAAHGGEAIAVIQGIRSAEENYRAETFGYLGCGRCEGAGCDHVQGSLDARYPHDVPDGRESSWSQATHPDYACWRQLGVLVDGPVRYTYSVIAGPAGVRPPPIPGLDRQPSWPTPREPWYVVQAVGDLDGDGEQSIAIGSSLSSDVYLQNESE